MALSALAYLGVMLTILPSDGPVPNLAAGLAQVTSAGVIVLLQGLLGWALSLLRSQPCDRVSGVVPCRGGKGVGNGCRHGPAKDNMNANSSTITRTRVGRRTQYTICAFIRSIATTTVRKWVAMPVDPRAGKPATPDMLVNVPRLITAYYAEKPDVSEPTQKVAFGTSGHRGSSLQVSFNENHILAISQAICEYRKARGHQRPAVSRQGHSCAERAGVRQRARSAAGERRRGHGRHGAGLHADAGAVACDPAHTTAGARASWRTAS